MLVQDHIVPAKSIRHIPESLDWNKPRDRIVQATAKNWDLCLHPQINLCSSGHTVALICKIVYGANKFISQSVHCSRIKSHCWWRLLFNNLLNNLAHLAFIIMQLITLRPTKQYPFFWNDSEMVLCNGHTDIQKKSDSATGISFCHSSWGSYKRKDFKIH